MVEFPSPFPNPRNKPFLFYFNIVKCASPLVLLEFQCPTPQVTCPPAIPSLSPISITRSFFPVVMASHPAFPFSLANPLSEWESGT